MKAHVLAQRKPSPPALDQPNLLFVSPVVPSDRGHGLAMRAALFLRALVEDWNVHLLVLPVAGDLSLDDACPAVVDRCAEVTALEPADDPAYRFIHSLRDPGMRFAALKAYRHPTLARFALPAAVTAAMAVVGANRFDAVHVFRLYLCPFAEPFLGKVRCSLDLDDDDVRTVARLAALSRAHGHAARSELDEAEAEKLTIFQAKWASRFAPVSVAGEEDADRLRMGLAGTMVTCVPNAVRLPRPASRSRAPGGPFTLMFVGTLGYLPNQDAAMLLAQDVLPEIRRRTARPVRLLLVGRDPGADLRALAGTGGIEVTGPVEELAPLYAASHVALAPLRGGGGTRIKILEAFAHWCPVVATPLGAEGIAVQDGEHLLLGDTPPKLAMACIRLLENPRLADMLAANAYARVAERYQDIKVIARIRDLLALSCP